MPLQSLKFPFILKQDLINFAQVGLESSCLSLLSVGMTGLCLHAWSGRHLSAGDTGYFCLCPSWLDITGSLGVNNSHRIE